MTRTGRAAAIGLLVALTGCASTDPRAAFLGEWSMTTDTGGGGLDAAMQLARSERVS